MSRKQDKHTRRWSYPGPDRKLGPGWGQGSKSGASTV